MYRTILEDLKKWKTEKEEGRLQGLLYVKGGARTGKTWVLKEFGRLCYQDVLYADCERLSYMEYLAKDNMEAERMIRMLSMYHGKPVTPGMTLCIFDNVEKIPELTSALLRLAEECEGLAVCMTGTGVEEYMHGMVMDSVHTLFLGPMSFREFLMACEEESLLRRVQENKGILPKKDQVQMQKMLEDYAHVGGMPEAVETWLETRSRAAVKECHQKIWAGLMYELQSQNVFLQKEELDWAVRAVLRELSEGSKGFPETSMTSALEVLLNRHLFCKMNRVQEGFWPPEQYEIAGEYRIYFLDIGLLGTLYESHNTEFREEKILKNRMFVEQFIYQELCANPVIGMLHYWEREGARMEFLFGDGEGADGVVVPIYPEMLHEEEEVLVSFMKQYQSRMAVMITEDRMGRQGNILEIPLYAVWSL